MPSKSGPQMRMMAGAAHNPAFASKVGVPQSVAKEFNAADKGKGKNAPPAFGKSKSKKKKGKVPPFGKGKK